MVQAVTLPDSKQFFEVRFESIGGLGAHAAGKIVASETRPEADRASDAGRKPEADHTKGVFDPEIRGKTDRYVLRFRKPE